LAGAKQMGEDVLQVTKQAMTEWVQSVFSGDSVRSFQDIFKDALQGFASGIGDGGRRVGDIAAQRMLHRAMPSASPYG